MTLGEWAIKLQSATGSSELLDELVVLINTEGTIPLRAMLRINASAEHAKIELAELQGRVTMATTITTNLTAK